MAVHVLASMSARDGQRPDALQAKMQAVGRSETRRAELHDGYAGRQAQQDRERESGFG